MAYLGRKHSDSAPLERPRLVAGTREEGGGNGKQVIIAPRFFVVVDGTIIPYYTMVQEVRYPMSRAGRLAGRQAGSEVRYVVL